VQGSNLRPKDYESAKRSKEINYLGQFLFRKFGQIASRRARIGAVCLVFAEQFSGLVHAIRAGFEQCIQSPKRRKARELADAENRGDMFRRT